MVESVRWLSKLHYYSSRIVPSRKSLLIHFCCEVASLFSNYLALESALCSDWLKYWRIVLLSNQKRVVFLSANQMLHLKQAAICVGHIPALSLATFRAFPVNQRCNILGEVVFFTENIMSSFLAWRELQLKCRRAVSLTLLNLLVSSIIQIHWRKKIKKKMIKWTSSNKSPWRQRKSWRITKNRFVFCACFSWIVWRIELLNGMVSLILLFLCLVEGWKRRTEFHHSRTDRRRPNIER